MTCSHNTLITFVFLTTYVMTTKQGNVFISKNMSNHNDSYKITDVILHTVLHIILHINVIL